MSSAPFTVAIAGGAGGVGSSLAYSLLLRSEPFDVIVLDRRPNKVASHVMDLELVAGGHVIAGGWDDVASADVLVICAATALTANTSRDVYLEENARIVDAVAERLDGFAGAVVMVSNPVDPLTARLARTLGDRMRVLGYTFNDTLRVRAALPGHRDVWVLGEHGPGAVPIFSRVTPPPTPEEQAAATDFMRGWYRRHVALDPNRSSTWTSGAGLARLLAAMAAGDGEQWVASVLLDGEYGLRDVATGVPVTLDRTGVAAIQEWELAADELRQLTAAL
jgi:malate/lactate dehydrogenase